MENRQANLIGRYIDRGLFIRHERPAGHPGGLFTRGFNSETERDSYMTVNAALNPEIVGPGDPEDPRKA